MNEAMDDCRFVTGAIVEAGRVPSIPTAACWSTAAPGRNWAGPALAGLSATRPSSRARPRPRALPVRPWLPPSAGRRSKRPRTPGPATPPAAISLPGWRRWTTSPRAEPQDRRNLKRPSPSCATSPTAPTRPRRSSSSTARTTPTCRNCGIARASMPPSCSPPVSRRTASWSASASTTAPRWWSTTTARRRWRCAS